MKAVNGFPRRWYGLPWLNGELLDFPPTHSILGWMDVHDVSFGNIANIFTFFRVALVPVFLVFLFGHTLASSVTAIVLFLTASITDYFDGLIARRRKLHTRFGEFMDPLADKLLVCSAFIAFALMPVLFIPAWLVALIILREIFVTVMRVAAIRRHAPIRTEFSGKLKTCFEMITIFVILLILVLQNVIVRNGTGQSMIRTGTEFWIAHLGERRGRFISVLPLIMVALSALFALISMVQYLVKNRHLFSKQAGYSEGS